MKRPPRLTNAGVVSCVAYVLSSNNERRHLSLPERAAATALTLATDGHRENGRWKRGAVPDIGESPNKTSTWQAHMRDSGTVLDNAPELLPQVAAGQLALDAAVRQATEIREEKKRRAELPDDLGVLVDNGELTINDALRRSALAPRYADLVSEGRLNIPAGVRSLRRSRATFVPTVRRSARDRLRARSTRCRVVRPRLRRR